MTLPAASSASFTSELAATLHDLAELVCRGVPGCDGASISLLRDGDVSTLAATSDLIRTLDQAQYARDDGPCVAAMRDRHEVAVPDYAADRRWPDIDAEFRAAGVDSSLSLPLTEGDRVLGGLNLYAEAAASFTADSRQAAEAFARQAVVTLGYLQQLHAERAAAQREREVSTALQASLLPVLPELPGIACAARYHVGSRHAQIGGDWYDLFALPDRAIGLAVGDVMGHDLAAAAAMGQLRSVLRSYAYEGSSPSVVLDRLDRLDRLVQDFEMAQLATAIYGRLVLDEGPAGGGMLLFTNAGHPPPLLRTPDGTVRQVRRGGAPLIGVVPPGQPLLHSTHADCTHRSTSPSPTPGSRCRSTRAGHTAPLACGVRSPHTSAIRSTTGHLHRLGAQLRLRHAPRALEPPDEPAPRRWHGDGHRSSSTWPASCRSSSATRCTTNPQAHADARRNLVSDSRRARPAAVRRPRPPSLTLPDAAAGWAQRTQPGHLEERPSVTDAYADTTPAPITTERLLLTPFRLADTDEHYDALIRHPQVARWLPSGRPGTPADAAALTKAFAAHWEQHGYGVFAVRDRTTGRLLGRGGLRRLPELDDPELLYALTPTAWGRGLATEAARAAVHDGLHRAGLTTLIGLVLPDNVASRRVLEHAGMTAEDDLVEVFGLQVIQFRTVGAGPHAVPQAEPATALPGSVSGRCTARTRDAAGPRK